MEQWLINTRKNNCDFSIKKNRYWAAAVMSLTRAFQCAVESEVESAVYLISIFTFCLNSAAVVATVNATSSKFIPSKVIKTLPETTFT